MTLHRSTKARWSELKLISLMIFTNWPITPELAYNSRMISIAIACVVRQDIEQCGGAPGQRPWLGTLLNTNLEITPDTKIQHCALPVLVRHFQISDTLRDKLGVLMEQLQGVANLIGHLGRAALFHP